MTEFEKGLRRMFSTMWDCKIDHPAWQDTVGDLMQAVIQLHESMEPPDRSTDLISKQEAINIAKDLLIKMAEYHQYNQAINNYCAELGKLSSVQPEADEWCTTCKEYDHEKHCCPRFRKVIRMTVQDIEERKKGTWIWDGDCFICSECGTVFNWWARSQCSNYCPNCGADMRGEQE